MAGEPIFKTAKLMDRAGALVEEVTVPCFRVTPLVLLHGARAFIYDPRAQGEYREVFTHRVDR